MEYFGFKLKSLRLEKHLTQKQLGSKLGVNKATISAYEKGSTYPSIDIMIKLCEYFDVSVDYMVGLKEQFSNMKSLSDEQYQTINNLINQFITLNELVPLDEADD